MSYSYVLPGEQSSSGSAKRWLVAYPLAQLICLGAATITAALARHLQWPDGSNEALATSVAIAAAYGLTFGYLRGIALRDKLARFSMPMWCTAIAVVSLFFLPPEPEALGLSTALSNLQAAARAAMPVALSGFVYGVVIGAAEAFSLRRAAYGLFGWSVMSGLAWGLGHIAASVAAGLAAPLPLTPLQSGAAHVACMTLQAAIAGIVMVLALRLITPRLRHYGPRVYRPAVKARG